MPDVALAVVAGQRRRTPGGQVIVISRVDYEQRLVWGHRESDGYPVAKGEGVALELIEDWPIAKETTITLRYADVPPSINDPKSGYKGHWAQAYRKNGEGAGRWKSVFNSLLLVQRKALPKTPAPYVRCSVVLTFALKRQRDEENFRVVLSKALADALVDNRVIADDSGEQFRLERVECLHGERDETVVTVSWPEP